MTIDLRGREAIQAAQAHGVTLYVRNWHKRAYRWTALRPNAVARACREAGDPSASPQALDYYGASSEEVACRA